jgi:hypothetical protein
METWRAQQRARKRGEEREARTNVLGKTAEGVVAVHVVEGWCGGQHARRVVSDFVGRLLHQHLVRWHLLRHSSQHATHDTTRGCPEKVLQVVLSNLVSCRSSCRWDGEHTGVHECVGGLLWLSLTVAGW